MKNVVTTLFLAILSFGASAQSASGKWFMACGDSKILLVDYAASKDSTPAVIWKWDAHESKNLPEEFRTKKFNSVDDCKALNGGERILVSSSSGAIAVINRKDGSIPFFASVPNAHSIEMLPGNLLVAAASTAPNGNRIILFDMNKPGKELYSDSLYSAHGLIWDKKRKLLYALGYDVFRTYELVTGPDPVLKLKEQWKIPGISGHDLQMAPDGDHLFMTETKGSWIFDLKKFTFNKINGFENQKDIKSIGLNASSQFIYTVPEESWWTFHVRFSNPARKMSFPDMKIYKARWVTD